MPDQPTPLFAPITRRTALRAGLVAGAALAITPLVSAAAPTARRSPLLRSGGKSVAIFGGGMAGLSAAHELAERGYEVTVYEPAFLGGEAQHGCAGDGVARPSTTAG